MPSYEVVKPCYIPFGGGMRYKVPGQVVTLEVEEAKNLDGYVRPTLEAVVRNPDNTAVVRNPDNTTIVRNPDSEQLKRYVDSLERDVSRRLEQGVENPDTSATIEQEVDSDVGDSQADHE